MSSYFGVGIMSGSSLDGLDVCYAEYMGDVSTDVWSYRIITAETFQYSEEMQNKLENAPNLSGQDLIKLHVDYGHYLGKVIREFCDRFPNERVDFIASHGHTIFHQPDRGFTFQLGDGETLVTYFKCPLVTNFRNKDVALGGQGAPLVPAGESVLFSTYDICINLGGIANISAGGKSFDITPCNMILNRLANMYNGEKMDVDGKIASQGKVIPELVKKWKALEYYAEPPPKSLSREWFTDNILPIVDTKKYAIQDLLRTSVEVIADAIVDAETKYGENFLRTIVRRHSITEKPKKSVLITGGGAFNKFLMEKLKDKLAAHNRNVVECDSDTINFKEALIFGFLGLRCLLGLANVNCSTTGSTSDSISGSIHLPVTHTPLSPGSRTRYNMAEKRISFDWVRSDLK